MSSDGDELTLSEAAARAGVSRSTIRRLRERGQLPNARKADGAGWLVTVGDLTRAGLVLVTAEQAREQGEQAAEQAREQGGRGGQPGSTLSLLSQLAPLMEQVSNLQAERGELLGEQRVLRFRLEQAEQQLADAQQQAQQPARAGSGLLLAAVALITAAAGWQLVPQLVPVGPAVTAAAGLLAGGWAWRTR